MPITIVKKENADKGSKHDQVPKTQEVRMISISEVVKPIINHTHIDRIEGVYSETNSERIARMAYNSKNIHEQENGNKYKDIRHVNHVKEFISALEKARKSVKTTRTQ